MEPQRKYEPQERWQKKAGYVSKSYKLKRDVVDAFSAACTKTGVSQSAQLMLLMRQFIDHSDSEN